MIINFTVLELDPGTIRSHFSVFFELFQNYCDSDRGVIIADRVQTAVGPARRGATTNYTMLVGATSLDVRHSVGTDSCYHRPVITVELI